MQLKHIEHPEDTILTGDLSAINWFTLQGKVSLKIDGCPAIVWGTNPENEKFFVGTKSVFNKVKKMICHSHEEIDILYAEKPDLADKLHKCFDNLVRTENIYQGDLIGIGGDDYYQPNTIGYLFPYKIEHNIIIAPHTEYIATGDTLVDTHAIPLDHILENDLDKVLYVQCNAIAKFQSFVYDRCQFAKQMATMVQFVDDKKAQQIKKTINHCIRTGIPITDDVVNAISHSHNIDPNLMRLWKLVKSIKMDALKRCEHDGWWTTFDDDGEIDGEGYVMWNRWGIYKLVNRNQFSRLNFLTNNNWVSS